MTSLHGFYRRARRERGEKIFSSWQENCTSKPMIKMTNNKQNELDSLASQIIGAAIEVHKNLGPGLLESTYETCLAHELEINGIKAASQVYLPIKYKNVELDAGYRIDLLIEESIIVELKAVESLHRNHTAQILAYLKLSGIQLGLLINFNVPQLIQGLKRYVNRF
jgi:GxxExxY protein